MSRTHTLIKAFAVLLSLALSSTVAAAQYKAVRVQMPSFALTTLPGLIAHDQGYDHDAGLDFTFTQAPGSIGVKAMLAGDVDFSLSVGSIISAAVTRAPVQVLAVHIAKSFYYLYAKKQLTTVKSLEGKSLGIGAIGDSTNNAAIQALKAGKADVSSVNFVSMGIDNVPASLLSGALDSGVVTPPRDIMLDRSDKFINLGFLGDYLVSPNSGFGTTKKLIEEQPELVQKVTDVIMRASKTLIEDRKVAEASMVKFLKLSPEDAALAWDKYIKYFLTDGIIDEESQKSVIADQIAFLKTRGTPPNPADIFAFRFVEKQK
jgi:ABC-type nitrate/sulfonate/bicarbonate transport system substrate-binding protein